MFSLLNKKTSPFLLLALCLLFVSLPYIQADPHSNLRGLQSNSTTAESKVLLGEDTDGGEETDNEDDSDSSDSDGGAGKGCWIESYGRGVGKPISVCPDGLEESGALCYPPCQEGYTGIGPVCWQNCPSGFSDTGADCLKPSSYGRGAGYALWHKSECEHDNPQGCEKNGALYYPKCKDGFHAFGCCVCSPNCPSGMTDIGVSCQKQSYGRGVGKPLVCTSSQDEDAGLCYDKCKAGWTGDGPVCWGSCPAGMYQCGALCLENEAACVNDMLQIANQVLQGISDYAGGDEDEEGSLINVANSGVNIGQQLAKYGMCTNM